MKEKSIKPNKTNHMWKELLLFVFFLLLVVGTGLGLNSYVEYRLEEERVNYQATTNFYWPPVVDVGNSNPDETQTPETPKEDLGMPDLGDNKENNDKNDNSNNGSNGSGPIKPPLPPIPPVIPTISPFLLGDFEEDTIKIQQKENQIIVNGSMNEKLPLVNQGINSGYYIQFRITAPRIFTEEELAHMYIKLPYSGSIYTQAANKVIDGKDSQGRAYFYLTQEFTNGKVISAQIDWGDGKIINYYIDFDVTVIPRTGI